jgi:hypothetical protein
MRLMFLRPRSLLVKLSTRPWAPITITSSHQAATTFGWPTSSYHSTLATVWCLPSNNGHFGKPHPDSAPGWRPVLIPIRRTSYRHAESADFLLPPLSLPEAGCRLKRGQERDIPRLPSGGYKYGKSRLNFGLPYRRTRYRAE